MTRHVPPHPDHSVTEALNRLKSGDEQAASEIWHRCCRRLARAARDKLGELPKRVCDEEELANSVFWSFCRGVEKGNFARLNDRHDLWLLLFTITEKRAIDRWRQYLSKKQGGGAVRGESSLSADYDARGPTVLDAFPNDDMPPDEVIEWRDQLAFLLRKLDDPVLQRVAGLRLDGATRGEIAAELGISVPTVDRKLRLIRETWRDELAPEFADSGPLGDA